MKPLMLTARYLTLTTTATLAVISLGVGVRARSIERDLANHASSWWVESGFPSDKRNAPDLSSSIARGSERAIMGPGGGPAHAKPRRDANKRQGSLGTMQWIDARYVARNENGRALPLTEVDRELLPQECLLNGAQPGPRLWSIRQRQESKADADEHSARWYLACQVEGLCLDAGDVLNGPCLRNSLANAVFAQIPRLRVAEEVRGIVARERTWLKWSECGSETSEPPATTRYERQHANRFLAREQLRDEVGETVGAMFCRMVVNILPLCIAALVAIVLTKAPGQRRRRYPPIKDDRPRPEPTEARSASTIDAPDAPAQAPEAKDLPPVVLAVPTQRPAPRRPRSLAVVALIGLVVFGGGYAYSIGMLLLNSHKYSVTRLIVEPAESDGGVPWPGWESIGAMMKGELGALEGLPARYWWEKLKLRGSLLVGPLLIVGCFGILAGRRFGRTCLYLYAALWLSNKVVYLLLLGAQGVFKFSIAVGMTVLLIVALRSKAWRVWIEQTLAEDVGGPVKRPETGN